MNCDQCSYLHSEQVVNGELCPCRCHKTAPLKETMPETANQLDLLITDIRALGAVNVALIIALSKCRAVLDEIRVDSHDHPLWCADQRDAIALADAALEKVMAP